MSGIFTQATTGADSTMLNGSKNDFLRAGTYLLAVHRHAFKAETRNSGDPMAIVEVDIKRVIQPGPNSNPVDTRAAVFFKLEVGRGGGLSDLGKKNMGRLQNYVQAILGGEGECPVELLAPYQEDGKFRNPVGEMFGMEPITDANGKLAGEQPIPGWDGTDERGIELIAECREGISGKGKPWSEVRWRPAPTE